MPKIHSIHAAKTNLSRLIEKAESGEQVVIARGSVPVVRLVRTNQSVPKRRFGAMRGRARTGPEFFEPLPPDELNGWE